MPKVKVHAPTSISAHENHVTSNTSERRVGNLDRGGWIHLLTPPPPPNSLLLNNEDDNLTSSCSSTS